MRRINFVVTLEELRLLASLASDQLFRRQFIDPKMPGYKGSPEELGQSGRAVPRQSTGWAHAVDHRTPLSDIGAGTATAVETTGDPMKNIFVGNLNSGTTPEAIRSLFEPLGT